MNKLYMVSLGPGDAQLLTYKALEAFKASDAICIPTKSSDKSFDKSISHKIVSDALKLLGIKRKLIPVYSPMQFRHDDWVAEADTILTTLRSHKNVSFVTIGDAGIYSSIYYLLDIIKVQRPQLYCQSEVIEGITSFSQASARVKKPLCVGDSRFEIIPLLDKEVPVTTVYMRPKIGMDTAVIQEKGTLYTFENMNYEGEQIAPYKKSRVQKYMTLFIDFFK
jgi:precorrin-2/cobalt-factor-2 C20-methyltransferase